MVDKRFQDFQLCLKEYDASSCRCLRVNSDFLNSYFNTETFSDAVVRCDGHEFKVHRVVLSAYLTYFEKAFTGPWKV